MNASIKYLVDTTRSPHATLCAVPVDAVQFIDDFWRPRIEFNRTHTVPTQYEKCEATRRFDNFRRAAGDLKDAKFAGLYFNDSDVYKWLEAAATVQAIGHLPADDASVDTAIRVIGSAQQPDGYLNTYFMFEREKDRWTNLKDLHELYCGGHMLQAAVMHYRATGKTSLLDIARRWANCVCKTFGPASEGKKETADGHEEVEMALVELYRATGETRYLEQAKFFIGVRGQFKVGDAYHQDHMPVREMDRLCGHAVRAVYLMCGAADVYLETGDPALLTANERLWEQLVRNQLYLTGGIGAWWAGEALGRDHQLPSERAYAETCAAIGLIMWSHRMHLATADVKYADLIEWAAINAVLCGLSLGGTEYFYQNPLADDGTHRRKPWFDCACCPPNIARFLAQLGAYAYSVRGDEIFVNLYATSAATLWLGDRAVTIKQQTRYPWDGDIAISVEGQGTFALHVRIPAWCESGATISVNGESPRAVSGGYAEVRRAWSPGDVLRVHLPMPVRRVESHPNVAENVHRVALVRGPVVYCVESTDTAGGDPRGMVLADSTPVRTQDEPILGGVTTLSVDVSLDANAETFGNSLYRTAQPSATPRTTQTIKAVPYYAWANRDRGRMQVWLRRG